MKYVNYSIANDMWYKKRKYIYYLVGKDGETGNYYVIGSYSLKSKQLLLKCANEHIPESYILKRFVDYCESKGVKDVKNL